MPKQSFKCHSSFCFSMQSYNLLDWFSKFLSPIFFRVAVANKLKISELENVKIPIFQLTDFQHLTMYRI